MTIIREYECSHCRIRFDVIHSTTKKKSNCSMCGNKVKFCRNIKLRKGEK